MALLSSGEEERAWNIGTKFVPFVIFLPKKITERQENGKWTVLAFV